MERSGRNQGGYRGETVAIGEVLDGIVAAAQRHGWQVECLLEASGPRLLGLHRPACSDSPVPEAASPRIYLSAGIHGDEPAGPLAVLRLLEENRWPPHAAMWICPCLNPSGFTLNRRENDLGCDLNRDYLRPKSLETRAHVGWLERQPAFDLTLCLHEDWESNGFYLYELNPDQRPSSATAAIEAVSSVCPIELSPVIEGREAARGIIRPTLFPASRPDWPEAFYLLQHKTRHSYTLEAPSDFSMAVRVEALVRAASVLMPTI